MNQADQKTNSGAVRKIFPTADEISKIQEERLFDLLNYVSANSPYYKRVFSESGINITQILSIQDLEKLPVTNKEDLQFYNSEFLCVPPFKVIEYTATSGTLGSPVTIALTEKDLQRLAYNEYNSFVCAECQPEDIFQLMLTLDRQFMAGMAYYSGIRLLGAGIIRVGPGVPSLQWETIFNLKPTVIVAVPSFILKLLQYAREHGIDPASTSVKKAICIGENIRHEDFSINVLGKRVSEEWKGLKLYSTYASTEMQTAFTECEAGQGGHLQPELLIVELLNNQNQSVAPGEPGEVTITTLGIEGMPLIRYKTGDICIADTKLCSCGRHSLRLSPVMGRKKQMIKFKGTTLFAPALFDILAGMEDILEYVIEVFSNEIGTDEVKLYLLTKARSEETDHRIRSYLQAKLRVTPVVSYVDAEVIQQMQFPNAGRKPVRFIDKRIGVQ